MVTDFWQGAVSGVINPTLVLWSFSLCQGANLATDLFLTLPSLNCHLWLDTLVMTPVYPQVHFKLAGRMWYAAYSSP